LLKNLPLNESDLYVNSNLNLFDSKITCLPDNLTVNGNLNLSYSNIKSLPNNLIVLRDLSICSTAIVDLPDDIVLKGCLWCGGSLLAKRLHQDKNLLFKYKEKISRCIFY